MYHTSANSLNIQANKHEKYRKDGLGFPGLVSETEQLTIDDHAALSPRSDHDSNSSVGSSGVRAPTFTESPPPSEKSAEGEGSKSTSRASSAEYSPPALSAFSHVGVEDSTVSHAEVVSPKNDVSPADLADDARTGDNLIFARSIRALCPKGGPTTLKTLSQLAALFPPMSIAYSRMYYQSWLLEGVGRPVAVYSRFAEGSISGFRPPKSFCM